MIKKGDEICVDIIDLNSEGKGISKLENNFVVFSNSTLPGDKAIIKIIRKKSNYAEGRLIEVIKNSSFRVIPKCRYFGICGGCKIQNYSYDEQLGFKTKIVRDAFERIGGFGIKDIPSSVPGNDIFYYRNKMEFSFSDDEWKEIAPEQEMHKKSFALGLHVPKFHSKIIDIRECFLQSELSNNILNFTRDFFKSKNIPVYSTRTQSGFLRFLTIRQSRNTRDIMINLITYSFEKELMNQYLSGIKKDFPEVSTVINSISSKKAQIAAAEEEHILFGSGFITEKLKTSSGKEYIFNISPQSFFQTNTLQAEKLFNTVVSFGDIKHDDNILDLYCGAGAISIFISDRAGKILGVELSSDAIKDAENNAKLNNIRNIGFISSDIKDFLESENVSGFNKLILDPPRAGLHPKICEILSETNFEKIVYVSCNPQTQARDLKIICGKNKYEIEKVQPVDMFPHTYHIENIAAMQRRGTD